MLSQSIWWSGLALEALLVVRGLQGRFALRYPVFYGYLSFVLLQDLLLFFAYKWRHQHYRDFGWAAEFLGVMLGCGIVFEVYRTGLSSYPGTARMARNVLAFIFALALAEGIANAWNDPRWWVEASTLDIDLALRVVQAVSIVGLVGLFLSYSIPFGKNLRGILLGYGLFIGMRVICLTFASIQEHNFWYYAYSGSYLVVLGIWLVHLWSYQPSPQQTSIRLEQDYQSIAAATRRRLQGARGYLAKAVRP
jgi:hypothetical protein